MSLAQGWLALEARRKQAELHAKGWELATKQLIAEDNKRKSEATAEAWAKWVQAQPRQEVQPLAKPRQIGMLDYGSTEGPRRRI